MTPETRDQGPDLSKRAALVNLLTLGTAPAVAEVAQVSAAFTALVATACKDEEATPPFRWPDTVDEYAGLTPEQQEQRQCLDRLKSASRPLPNAEKIVIGPDKRLTPEHVHEILTHLMSSNVYFDHHKDELTHFGDWMNDPRLGLWASNERSVIGGPHSTPIVTKTDSPYLVIVELHNYLGDDFKGGQPSEILVFHEGLDGNCQLHSQETHYRSINGETIDTSGKGTDTHVFWQKGFLSHGRVAELGAEWEFDSEDYDETPLQTTQFGLLEKADGTIEMANEW